MTARFIDVVSDSTGETAEKVLRAALLQFPQAGAVIRLHPRVRTKEIARTLLAQRGLKAANLPSVVGVPPPHELEQAAQDRIVGLTIGLDQLCEIRQARLRQLGMPAETNYALREHVKEELAFASRLFASHPSWPVIDVTGRAIEETAVIILESLRERDARVRAVQA